MQVGVADQAEHAHRANNVALMDWRISLPQKVDDRTTVLSNEVTIQMRAWVPGPHLAVVVAGKGSTGPP